MGVTLTMNSHKSCLTEGQMENRNRFILMEALLIDLILCLMLNDSVVDMQIRLEKILVAPKLVGV
jgi:hypothetical protein